MKSSDRIASMMKSWNGKVLKKKGEEMSEEEKKYHEAHLKGMEDEHKEWKDHPEEELVEGPQDEAAEELELAQDEYEDEDGEDNNSIQMDGNNLEGAKSKFFGSKLKGNMPKIIIAFHGKK